MDGVGGTHLHALAAANAAGEEVVLSKRARRTNQGRIESPLGGFGSNAEEELGAHASQARP